MRPYVRWTVFIFILAGLSGCGGPKGARLQQAVIPADKTLYQTGNDFLQRSQFTQARLAYQTLIRTYPGSELEADAYFQMGRSFRQEGGTENMLLAEDQFRNFIVFFPTNARAPDAEMEIIAILMAQMRSPDRDQKETVRAEQECLKFLTLYPDNDYAPIVKGYLDEVRENLALHDLSIGDFYAHGLNYNGAASRYEEVTQKYPRFSHMDEIYYKLAEAQLAMADVLDKLENPEMAKGYRDQAVQNLAKVREGYPFSPFFDNAGNELVKQGKPVPEVDQQLAALNQALLKPSPPFSPLRPLIDLASAMGIIGPPDRYEEARKAVEAAHAAAEAAAASSSAATQTTGSEPTINAVISKSGDGKAVNPKVTPQKTDKKDDKKAANPVKKK